jgi:hypothetical protein
VIEVLGCVRAPSGELAIFDVGILQLVPPDDLARWVVKVSVPADRELRVVGKRLGTDDVAEYWDSVAVEVGDAPTTREEMVGEVTVDFARILMIDRVGFAAWEHEQSLDGKADFVFWGRDAEALAHALGAPAIAEGFGWLDLDVDECIARGTRAEDLKAERGWKLATDFRPHSHHYLALAQLRATDTGSGTIEVGGAPACLFATSWGDGVFPVYVDRDAAGALVRVRVQLATPDSLDAMRAVNS